MCGIAGLSYFGGTQRVEVEDLRRMAESMVHRGPDDEGFFASGPIGLAHRRLSIIDRAGGHQPMTNADGSVVVVFNGEIYNHRELRRVLEAKGRIFRTHSDTEAILHVYEEYGDDFERHLTGMFAIAIWDQPRQRLVLSRDRLGIKPLYYTVTNGRLAFASEIKAILALEGMDRRLDRGALDAYLDLRYVPAPRTMFADISKLEPGHTLVAERGAVSVRSYWDLQFRQEPIEEEAALAQFDTLLHRVCERHLMSEVPYGVFLSGGLDSSAIAVLIRSLVREDVPTFTVGYDGATAANEFAYARLVGQGRGETHHEIIVPMQDFADWIPRLVWHLDEPVADPACIPLYFLARSAKPFATVLHSGEGADEILAGYSIYGKMETIETIRRSPLGGVAGTVGSSVAPIAGGGKLSRYLNLLSQPLEQRYRGVSGQYLAGFRRALLGGSDTVPGANGGFADETFSNLFSRVHAEDGLNRMLYVDTKVWLPDDLLVKADKMTMAASVELRVPFLDHELVEFAARLPVGLKRRRRETKYLLRRLMARRLPSAILKRNKKGFPVPIADWFRGGLGDLAQEMLTAPTSAVRQLLHQDTIRTMIGRHRAGRTDLSGELWGLLVLEYWFRTFKVTA